MYTLQQTASRGCYKASIPTSALPLAPPSTTHHQRFLNLLFHFLCSDFMFRVAMVRPPSTLTRASWPFSYCHDAGFLSFSGHPGGVPMGGFKACFIGLPGTAPVGDFAASSMEVI